MVPFTIWVWLLLAVTLPPLWLLLIVLPAGPMASRAVTLWARLILRVTRCPIVARGLERLGSVDPAVIVVNHTSYLDAVALMAALPMRFRFVVNHRAAAWPLVGLAIRKSQHLVVDRGRMVDRRDCALQMIETLREGSSVVVFPEGTFDRQGRLLPFQPGSFRVAAEAGRPVVPITLRGTRHVLDGGLGRLRRGTILLTVGAPLPATSTDRRDILRLRDRAREEIAAQLTDAHAS